MSDVHTYIFEMLKQYRDLRCSEMRNMDPNNPPYMLALATNNYNGAYDFVQWMIGLSDEEMEEMLKEEDEDD